MKCPKCSSELEIRLVEDRSRDPHEMDHLDLESLLDAIDDSTLKGESKVFVQETRERWERYGNKIRMSEKQMNWLRALANDK